MIMLLAPYAAMRPEGAKKLKVLLVYRSRLFISATKGRYQREPLALARSLAFR